MSTISIAKNLRGVLSYCDSRGWSLQSDVLSTYKSLGMLKLFSSSDSTV